MSRKRKSEHTQEYQDAQLASYWNMKFKEAMIAKAPYTKAWQEYMEAYKGDYFVDKSKPNYKSDLVSNYIFSIIETIRPIMLDNDPKFLALPRHPDGMEFANDLQEAFNYEWDRARMNTKLYRELITTLVTGTTPFFVPWDSETKEIKSIPVNPFNLFPDPLATGVEDAEYLIYASYKNAEQLRRSFPKFKEKLQGGDINYGELVHDNNENSRVDNQILILEVWTRDYETREEDQEQKYPNGRVITIAPDLGLVLKDRANPYKDGKFPFVLMKDYDVPGKFWGEGEVAQLLSPQKHMNELNNAIIDNAKSTANMPWIVDKNAGIPRGAITNRPGLILRKNPGSELRREQPPNLPAFVVNAVHTMKEDMEQVSGIFDSLKGNSETGVYTAQGVLALQEAGQARIRLKVKLMEDFLGRLAELWFDRMKQFWKDERFIRVAKVDGTYDLKQFKGDTFKHSYDIKIHAGSTMPVNRSAMLDLMIRLAQTVMPDGQAIVDREAVAEYLPPEVRSAMMGRMQQQATAIEEQLAQLGQMLEQMYAELQQVAEQSDSNDEETFEVIEQLTGAIEEVQSQIVQLQSEHDRLEEERRVEEERNQIRTDAYNEGYTDAESYYSEEDVTDGTIPPEAQLASSMGSYEGDDIIEGLPEEELMEDLGTMQEELPEDILRGLEELTDDELALLMRQNPELADLLR